VRPDARLSLNRETLRRLSSGEAEAVAAGLDRTFAFQVSAGQLGLCSVSMGVTGNSLGCTSVSIAATLGTSIVAAGGPH